MFACRNCGSHVTRHFARVFGNNRDEVEGCPDCMTARELHNGEARPDGSKHGTSWRLVS